MKNPTEENIRIFFERFKEMRFKKEETIIRAEDSPTGVFYIKSGYVKMNTIFENGSELTLNIFKPGAFFPTVWAIGEVENAYNYQTITDTVVCRAPRDETVEFLKIHPEVLYDLTRRLLIGMDGLFTNIRHMLYGNSYNRVAAAVVICAKRFGRKGDSGEIEVALPLTHRDIGNMAGLTRETTSIAMRQLKDKRVITQNRFKLIIKDMSRLESEAMMKVTTIFGLE